MIALAIALAFQQAPPPSPDTLESTATVCRIAVERKRAGDATWLQRELRQRPEFRTVDRNRLYLICAGYALAAADAERVRR